ncbi:MAG: OLD family protein [Acidimicrobiales bacterium]
MRILRCTIQNFRGFDAIDVIPRGHVLLVGEPRAGRSDLLAALGKVFEVDATRLDELDFHLKDTTQDIGIEVTIGDLDELLEQRFLDQLEFWNPESTTLLQGVEDPAAIPAGATSVIRLAYRGRWDDADERGAQYVYWPKFSTPEIDDLRRVTREDRAWLPFHRFASGRPLNLAPRGLLRSALDQTEAEALGEALQGMRDGIDHLSAELSLADPVIGALSATFEVLRPYFGIDDPVQDIVRFLPDEGSLSGLLRALAPALDLGEGFGHLPLSRHGSTTHSQVASAEAIATASHHRSVVVVDDFGDALDASSAERLAALLRDQAGQVWLSTRRAETARSFEVTELVRLTRSLPGVTPRRAAHRGVEPASRAERVAARELHRQILPAMTARALIVTEGPHDTAAYGALAERLELEADVAPPQAYGVRLVDAGSTSGGIDQVARVARLAHNLGFRVVAMIDYDRNEGQAAAQLAEIQAASDAVVRMPKGRAVERALLEGIPDDEIVAAITTLNQTYSLSLPPDWQTLTGGELAKEAISVLKSNGGLHAQFLYALPTALPPLATAALRAATDCARAIAHDAMVQL